MNIELRAGNRIRLAILILAMGSLLRAGVCFDPAAGDFAKERGDHLRVLTWNVQQGFISNPDLDGQFRRILAAVHPDMISFQEIDSGLSAGEIEVRMESVFPAETWSVHLGIPSSGIRNALASRYPLSLRTTDTDPPSEVRGVTAALVDLPDAVFGTTDLYVMGIHFKSFGTTSDHERRQKHADAIISWMRDARTSGGSITLPGGTPMLIAGDTNLGFLDEGDEAPYHATRTLRDGDIFDEATYGPDSPPDWDGTESGDAAPYDHTNADSHTHSSREAVPESRFDRMVFTDSVIHPVNRFVFNTGTMSPSALSAAGLMGTDSADASDHLPVVTDFAMGPDPAPPAYLLVNEFIYDDPGTDDRTFIELKNAGGRELNLQAPVDYQLVTSNSPLPAFPPGTENELSRFDLQGIIPPRGLVVLYDRLGETSGIAPVIEANLPQLQRQDLTAFSLPNGPDVAIALLTAEPVDVDIVEDMSVEAYMYEDSTPAAANYLRTANGLIVELLPAQSTTLSLVSDTESLSRNRGDAVRDSFANWTNPDEMTPGLENATGQNLVGWEIY